MVKLGATACGLLLLAWLRHHPLTRALGPMAIGAYALVMVLRGFVESEHAAAP